MPQRMRPATYDDRYVVGRGPEGPQAIRQLAERLDRMQLTRPGGSRGTARPAADQRCRFGVGSILGSFIHVRDRSPAVTPIVFARLADGGGRR
jgi:hypothetical protein